MPRLIKSSTAPQVARHFVHGPGFQIDVAAPPATLPDGWAYVAEDVEPEDLIPDWAQPAGAEDAYAKGAEVLHAGKRWTSLVNANGWEPGISCWREVPAEGEHPDWRQPTGAHDAYGLGAMARHAGRLWRSTRAGNVWEPNTQDAGWVAIVQVVAGAPAPAWVDTGATVAQLVAAGVYRVSKGLADQLSAGQAIRLGTVKTVFNGFWSSQPTYLLVPPSVSAPVGAVVWKWS